MLAQRSGRVKEARDESRHGSHHADMRTQTCAHGNAARSTASAGEDPKRPEEVMPKEGNRRGVADAPDSRACKQQVFYAYTYALHGCCSPGS